MTDIESIVKDLQNEVQQLKSKINILEESLTDIASKRNVLPKIP